MKKITTILLITVLIVLSITGCGNKGPKDAIEYGDIENSETSEENTEKEISEAGLPSYDPSSVTQALSYGNEWKLTPKTSYYKLQLDTRPKRAFDTLYYAMENLVSSVEFESSQLVTPSELENIMHILFLDCPELFWVDTVFSYSVNEEGYVTNVNLTYTMDADKIGKIKEENLNKKPSMIQLVKDNDYDTIKQLMKQIFTVSRKWQSVGINQDGSYDFSCMNTFESMYGNSIGNAKMITYWLRECGIDCTLAVGELVSSTLEDEYELTTDYINFRESQGADGFYTIRYNYSYYWAWNLVKIDDKWYNLDYSYSTLINEHFKPPYKDNSLLFCTDLMMSQTRLSYMNEEILGIMPSCTDVNFQPLYREGKHILPMTETQALKKIQSIIYECDSQHITDISYQCQDEQTFNYIINNIDEQIENYNNTYGNPIGGYKTLFIRDNLTITLRNIIYNY